MVGQDARAARGGTDHHETGGAKGAREALDARLDAGELVIAALDLQSIEYWGLPDALSGYIGHTVVIFGRDAGGAYLVDDRGQAPFHVPPDVMSAARGRIGTFKNRMTGLRTTPGPIAADRLRAAMLAGLEDQVAHLRSPSDSFSLPAWRKWARLMTDDRNAKAWPRVFADGDGLFGSLLDLLELVDGDVGAYGGHLRELYAASLDEAAAALEIPDLGDAARRGAASTDLWEGLADSAVPPDLDGADGAVEAVETLRGAVMGGEPERARVLRPPRRHGAIRHRYADEFPLPTNRVAEILRGLANSVAGSTQPEVDALEATARAIGR